MKLGAQLYSVRNGLTTPEEMRKTFAKIKSIGYENVQLSGHPRTDAAIVKSVSEEAELPIVLTHSPFERIVNETDVLIAEHKLFACPVIGLGIIPKEYRGTQEGLNAFLTALSTPVKKILDAGLHFAYHNHDLEFNPLSGGGDLMMDQLLERCPDWQFILDTYWVERAGYSAVEYIRKIGGARLPNIHFKDMANDVEKSICHCGAGVLDFAAVAALCKEIGVQNVLVEQDNAVKFDDPFAEMQASFCYLRPII